MNKLQCGVSKVTITPAQDLLPKLYGLMCVHFAGVIDDIHVRVMILSNETSKAMFVAWELDKAPCPETFIPKISALSGIPEDNILYFGVHTHTAPLHSDRPSDGPCAKSLQSEDVQKATDIYEGFLYSCLEKAVKEAMDSMQDVKIGYGIGESYVGENRLQDYFVENEDGSVTKTCALGSNRKREVDRELFVMRVEALDGTPVAFFVNHAVHCCIMIMNNFDGNGGVGISGDLAGAVSTLLENKFPGCIALWSSGAAGNINPVMMNQYITPDPETGADTETRDFKTTEPARLMLHMLSRRQFAEILQVNRTITCSTDEAAISGGSLTVQTPGKDVICESFHGPFTYVVNEDTAPYEVLLHGLRIGNISFCGASGELFDTLGKVIKTSVKCGSDDPCVVINHDRSVNLDTGYIFDDEAIERCTHADGTISGLPTVNETRMLTGYIEEALKEGSAKLFSSLK